MTLIRDEGRKDAHCKGTQSWPLAGKYDSEDFAYAVVLTLRPRCGGRFGVGAGKACTNASALLSWISIAFFATAMFTA